MISVSLQDILKTFDSWKDWKHITECPKRIDSLEQQIEELKQQVTELKRTPPGKQCPSCFQPTLSMVEQKKDHGAGKHGYTLQVFKCTSCDFEKQDSVKL